MFRHALLLSGGAEPTSQQAERMLASALESCERFYQAFQFVIWADKRRRGGAGLHAVRDPGPA